MKLSDVSPSVRELIMRYLANVLIGLQNDDGSDIPVYRTRLDKLPQDELPAFNVTIETDKEVDLSTDSIEHELLINLDCISASDEETEDDKTPPRSIDEVADPLTVWAEQRAMLDETMGGHGARCDWTESHWTNIPQDLDITGVRLRFKVMYFTERGDPTNPSQN